MTIKRIPPLPASDPERWARIHIAADKREGFAPADSTPTRRVRRLRPVEDGMRRERGGWIDE